MKLSEAIRLGAMLKPQGHGLLHVNGRTCALGAAYDAVGHLDEHSYGWRGLERDFPILLSLLKAPCPIPTCQSPFWRDGQRETWAIPHLNDYHRWTREQIADWVETIERRADADSARTEHETASTAVSFAQKA